MDTTSLIGMLAAIGTTLSFIPQAIKVIRTRDTKSISLWMYLLLSIGVALWLIYGVLKKDPSIIAANAVTLFFALIIFCYKVNEKV